MIIDCISDCHGFQPQLPGGDLLIIAGDLTARDWENEHALFDYWLNKQKYSAKLIIAGNHDGFLEKSGKNAYGIGHKYIQFGTYLQDEGCSFNGYKIWGSPWTPTFSSWHFMKDRGEPIKKMWDLIPDDTEILITHGPAFGIQDEVDGELAGCEELRNAIDHRLKKLKLHVFGHIHESYGKVVVNGVIHVNASILDGLYRPVNKPIRVIL